MKRITALLIALLMLCLMIPTGVAAEEEKPLWITHFNNNSVEGSGVIFTEAYTGAVWWIHFAFAPTDVEGVYQIVDTSNGLTDGSALALEIPEGGFVWASNYGNDYISLGIGDTDYTSANCSDCINDVSMNWMTGTLVKFTGLDLEGQTIPTSTSDIEWYKDDYVCTATYTIYEGDANVGGESEAESEAESVEESSEAETASSEVESVAESKTESVAATESSEAADANDDGGLGTGAIVAIVVAAVAVICAVVAVLVKKKK